MNITFIGTLDSTFTSRWKREIPTPANMPWFFGIDDPTDKTRTSKNIGREGAKAIAKNGLGSSERIYSVNLPNSKNKNVWRGPPTVGTQMNREIYKIDKTPIIQESVNSRLEKYKTDKKLKSSIVKYKPSKNSTNTKTQSIKPKFKLGMKGRLGLGAIGLAATGALAYGLARKIRSDKGKKRRFYNR